MQKKEIRVGGVYEVRIGKSLTEAAVNRIDKGVFFITDLATHRRHQVKTAGKFIRYLRMNAEPPLSVDIPNLKPLEEHTPPKVESKDMEPRRNKLRRARRLLEEAHDLVGYKDIESRINDGIERIARSLQSLSGPNGKTPYAQVEVDLEDVEDQRTNLQAVHALMKRVGNAQMAGRVKSLLGEVDHFLLGLIQRGRSELLGGDRTETPWKEYDSIKEEVDKKPTTPDEEE